MIKKQLRTYYEGRYASAAASILSQVSRTRGSYLFGPGIKTVATCSVASHDVEAELLSLIEVCVPDIVNA